MSGPYAPLTDTSPSPRPIVSVSEDGAWSAPLEQVPQQSGPPANWSVPPGLAGELAEGPSEDELKDTATDALQQDANPPEYPPGSPKLRPYMRLPRRERAAFFRKLKPLQELMGDLPKQGDSVDGDRAAAMYDSLAQVEDFLRPMAEDPAAFDTWLVGPGSDDKTFVTFFSAYFAGAQLGEADSSSN